MAIVNFLPGASWEPLVGGALGGAFLSWPLNYQRLGAGWQKTLGWVGSAAVPALAVGLVAYGQGSISEPLKVRRDLFPPYRDAEERAATVFNKQAVPLLGDWGNNIDATRLGAVRLAFQEAQRQLDEALVLFDQAGPFQEPKVSRTIRQARAYLEEWSKFYALFSKTIAPPPPWPAEPYRALAGQLKEIDKARRPLANSPLLPPAYSEK